MDEQDKNLNPLDELISLSNASKYTGYHSDYLSYLARTGKLQAQKIGRNWVTTRHALQKLNDKNVSEISDETGKKISVRIQTLQNTDVTGHPISARQELASTQIEQGNSVMRSKLTEIEKAIAENLQSVTRRFEQLEKNLISKRVGDIVQQPDGKINSDDARSLERDLLEQREQALGELKQRESKLSEETKKIRELQEKLQALEASHQATGNKETITRLEQQQSELRAALLSLQKSLDEAYAENQKLYGNFSHSLEEKLVTLKQEVERSSQNQTPQVRNELSEMKANFQRLTSEFAKIENLLRMRPQGQTGVASPDAGREELRESLSKMQQEFQNLLRSSQSQSRQVAEETKGLLKQFEGKLESLADSVNRRVLVKAVDTNTPELQRLAGDIHGLGEQLRAAISGDALERTEVIKSIRESQVALQTEMSQIAQQSQTAIESLSESVRAAQQGVPASVPPSDIAEVGKNRGSRVAFVLAAFAILVLAVLGSTYFALQKTDNKLALFGEQIRQQFFGQNYQPKLTFPLTKDIDQRGGRLSLVKDDHTLLDLNFPQNTVSELTHVTVSGLAIDDLESLKPNKGQAIVDSQIYQISAKTDETAVSQFGKPLTITFSYDLDKIAGYKEDDLSIFYWDEQVQSWVELPQSQVDTFSHTVTATTYHFTIFALIAKTRLPAPSTITIRPDGSSVLQGSNGSVVTKIISGLPGSQGLQGPTGPQGPPGLAGPQGPAGTSNIIIVAPDAKEGGLAGSFKYLSASTFVTDTIKITSLTNCDTLDTDGSGNVVCGSDATGGSSGITASQWNIFDGNILAPTSTGASLAIGGSTQSSAKFFVDAASGNATTSGALVIGTTPPTLNLIPGDLWAGRATTTALAITTLSGCTLKTDSAGNVFCGTDLTGGSGSAIIWNTYLPQNIIAPTSTTASFAIGGSDTNAPFLVTSTGLASTTQLTVSGAATTSASLVVGATNPSFNLQAGDLFVGRQLFVSGASRISVLNATTTNIDNLFATGGRITTLNSTTTNVDTLTVNTLLQGTGANNFWDSRFNATSTWAGFQSEFNTKLNATSTVLTENDLKAGANISVTNSSGNLTIAATGAPSQFNLYNPQNVLAPTSTTASFAIGGTD
ncbi:MAG TPA: hypothetical protein VJK50_00650, partial [Patescibacteria group bacterium]|nr:hypothetical protein [Patescibacteria group bacterium]